MTFRLEPFANVGLDEPTLRSRLISHSRTTLPRLRRFWSYYRNPIINQRDPLTGVNHKRTAQEEGLPARLTAPISKTGDDRDPAQHEIVIENDIAWRLHAMVDFLAGKPISILSSAHDEQKRRDIQRILDAVFEASGGMTLLQDAALLSNVYGYVDFLLRTDELFTLPRPSSPLTDIEAVIEQASKLRIELVEPPRAVPVQNVNDYRSLDAYIVHFARPSHRIDEDDRAPGALASLRARLSGGSATPAAITATEIFSQTHHQIYENDRLIIDEPNPLGELPIVHIQNISQPFHYDGLSEVEPLIPLQNELNTRLSDRANRVTLQSFKLYLAKGLDDDGAVRSISPGQVWTTDNPDASIEAFGGDAQSPSEDNHIQQIRDAMDKTSAVTPLAVGLIRARVGQLSSENALRISLLGMLSKTGRKQLAFGKGIAQLSAMILTALDRAGVLHTEPRDRAVSVQWPEPIPQQEKSKLDAAILKAKLGVPKDRILAELGYTPNDTALS